MEPVPKGPLHVLVDSTGLQIFGAGQWLEDKHGGKSRRGGSHPQSGLGGSVTMTSAATV